MFYHWFLKFEDKYNKKNLHISPLLFFEAFFRAIATSASIFFSKNSLFFVNISSVERNFWIASCVVGGCSLFLPPKIFHILHNWLNFLTKVKSLPKISKLSQNLPQRNNKTSPIVRSSFRCVTSRNSLTRQKAKCKKRGAWACSSFPGHQGLTDVLEGETLGDFLSFLQSYNKCML